MLSVNDKASKAISVEAAEDISTRVRIRRGKKKPVATVEGAMSSPRPHNPGGPIIIDAFGSTHKQTEEVRRQRQVHDLCDSNTSGKEVPLVKRPSDVSAVGANAGRATSEALVSVGSPTGQFASNSTPADSMVMTTIPVAGSVMSTTAATETQTERLHKATLDAVNALGQHAICQEKELAVYKEGQLIQKLNRDLICANAKVTALTTKAKRMGKEMITLRDALEAAKKREKELSARCYEQEVCLTTLKHRKASIEIANRSLATEINVLLEKGKGQLLEFLAISDKVRVLEVEKKACWEEGYTTGDKECKDLIEQMYPDFDWAQFEKLEEERDARKKADHPAT